MNKTGLWFVPLSLLIMALDGASKYAVVSHFALYESKQLLPFFNITYVQNFGSAFSFLADGSGWQKFLFIGISVLVSLGLIILLHRSLATKTMQNLGYALVLGGAMGNGIDRMINGYVIDFFHFYLGSWHYPIFNIADCAIVGGAVTLIIESFISKESS